MIDVKIKVLFFDSQKVKRAMDKATRKSLAGAGAYIMNAARWSIKKRRKPSPPGSPPSSHIGTLKRLIFFNYDPANKTVVIGPQAIGSSDAPSVLEFGGKARRTVVANKRRKGKKAKTQKGKKVTATYKPRPFMGPALAANVEKIPKKFAGSLGGR